MKYPTIKRRIKDIETRAELARALEDFDKSNMVTGELFHENATWLLEEFDEAKGAILMAMEHLKASKEGVVAMDYAVHHALAALSAFDPDLLPKAE